MPKGTKVIDWKNLPDKPGVYEAKGVWGNCDNFQEIDVYHHPIKGLCVFQEDYGGEGPGIDDSTDCHVSVQNTGLIWGRRLRDLDKV